MEKIEFLLPIKSMKFRKIHMLCIIAACLIVCFYSDTNVFQVTKELVSGCVAEYAKECDKRNELMKKSEGDSLLYVDELPDSEILKFSDLTEDITHWKNATWSEYYGGHGNRR